MDLFFIQATIRRSSELARVQINHQISIHQYFLSDNTLRIHLKHRRRYSLVYTNARQIHQRIIGNVNTRMSTIVEGKNGSTTVMKMVDSSCGQAVQQHRSHRLSLEQVRCFAHAIVQENYKYVLRIMYTCKATTQNIYSKSFRSIVRETQFMPLTLIHILTLTSSTLGSDYICSDAQIFFLRNKQTYLQTKCWLVFV